MSLGREEEIVRAICTDKWDGQRVSPSLFKGANISVSRLSVLPLNSHWDLFSEHVQKPPERLLERIGQINIGKLQLLGAEHAPATALTVEAKPVDWNSAHAEIPQNITRGLANKIVAALTLHEKPKDPIRLRV